MKLRRKEYCPIHRSLYCCGREPIQKGSSLRRLGVQRIEDPHHPRGYRELRSKAEMRKLLNRKIIEQNGNVRSVRWRSRVTATSYPTTSIREEWEERGETTIPTISRLCTSGATAKRDRLGSIEIAVRQPRGPFDRVWNSRYNLAS